MDNKYSYTAAGTLPAKLIRHSALERFKVTKRLEPIHAQICPTNRCNLKCDFCSCKNVDKDKELSYEEISLLAGNLKKLGTKAVTITGGGEPLMHDSIDLIIKLFYALRIDIGLVTNGLLLDRVRGDDLERLTWCRISCSDEIPFKEKIYKNISKDSSTDFAFSYVVTESFSPDNLLSFIEFANDNKFSHVRVVSDLINLDNVEDMDYVKERLGSAVDDSLVIYQGRKDYTRGRKKCYISQLKPLIAPDGEVYPCCGVQYASTKDGGDLSFPASMSMGVATNFKDLKAALEEPFDGSNCDKCYYEGYNEILAAIDGDIKHGDFL